MALRISLTVLESYGGAQMPRGSHRAGGKDSLAFFGS